MVMPFRRFQSCLASLPQVVVLKNVKPVLPTVNGIQTVAACRVNKVALSIGIYIPCLVLFPLLSYDKPEH